MKSLLSPHWAKLESLIDIEPPEESPNKFTFTPKKPNGFNDTRSNIHVPKNWSATRRGSPPKDRRNHSTLDLTSTTTKFISLRPVTTETQVRRRTTSNSFRPRITSNSFRPRTNSTRIRPGTSGGRTRPGTTSTPRRPGTTKTRATTMIPKEGAAGFSYD